MPTLPSRLCGHVGCGNYALPGKSRCAEHMDEAGKRVSDNADLYKSAAWSRLRGRQLRAQPLCAECRKQGKMTIATEVDHIIPHKGDKTLFFDANNLQSMCKSCHSQKTAREDGGWGRVRARNR